MDAPSQAVLRAVAWAGEPIPLPGLAVVMRLAGGTDPERLVTRLWRSGLLERVVGPVAEGVELWGAWLAGESSAQPGWVQRCKLWGLAVRQRRRLVEQEGRGELANDLATALYNLALAHDGRGARGLAQAAAGEALEIRRRLVTGGLGAFAAEFG